MSDNKDIELEVRRILASEIDGHRNFLQSQFRNLTWAVGIMFSVGALVFTFFLGKSYLDSKDNLIHTVDSKLIDYRIVESFKNRLDEHIAIAVDNAVEDKSTTDKINEKISTSTKSALALVEESVEKTFTSVVKSEITKSQNLNASEIIKKVSMPSGSVLAFNRKSCPTGWKVFAPAQGRFIRGIDNSGKDIDPDGLRDPGSIQDSEILRHSHTSYMVLNGWPKESGDRTKNGSPNYLVHSSQRGKKGDLKTSVSGGEETRPENVALLYCEKDI